MRHAASLEVLEGRLRHPDIDRPFRGIRLTATPLPDDEDRWERRAREVRTRVQGFALRMAPYHAFSHVTAGEVLGLRLPSRVRRGSLIDVGSIHPARALRATGVRRHELLARTHLMVTDDGFVVTSPIDTWLSLASMLSVDELIVIGDGLVCRENPVATIDELVDAVERARRRPGAAKLRRALLEIRPRTDSARETLLRLMVVRAGFPEPEVNGRIENEHGVFIAWGDLLYRDKKVLLEYDGGGHRTEKQYHRDIDRLDAIMELDIRVIRVNKSLMSRRATLFRKLRDALDRNSPVAKRD